jgi:superfamily I DNA/RNA helicase/mRNA-degrading endonuclease RelE of RelBE toxin-antitoxin system
MEFRIADTFTDSLARLTADEQKLVKTTAFDLQVNPSAPGLGFHKLEQAKDKHFCSVRVGSDIRLIVHRTDESLLLCYVNHHDKAYQWAERRRLETHPRTGAAQLVEIRETVKEIVVPVHVESRQPVPPKPPLFKDVADDTLLGFGVPKDWLADVRAANEDTLLALTDHLPGEAAEALLELATGGKPVVAKVEPPATPFAHPDAQRRFRVMANVEELERALEFPWDRWTVFLHPAQRQLVERDYTGPARVSGSAGTGKTIVALHRAVFLARANPDARVLLTTFSETLANAMRIRLRRLISNEPRLAERLEVHAIDQIGERLFAANKGTTKIVSDEDLRALVATASREVADHKFSIPFLVSEWTDIVDAWQIETWEAYRDVARLGRKTRLAEKQRAILWTIFELVQTKLAKASLITNAGLLSKVASILGASKRPPFDFAVVDEAQDLGVPHLRFLAALGGGRRNGLFFAGDLGQRIFQPAFSWRALGVEIRGRSSTLRVNYRTSHQIRMQADRLLSGQVTDADGNTEGRVGTVSVFNGPVPEVVVSDSREQESARVASWLRQRLAEGVVPQEIAIFVRSPAEVERASAAADGAGVAHRLLDERVATTFGQVSISTMNLAKGLEFRAVAVMACDDEVVPLQARIESITDEADLEEVYTTERHLLYVACTRARDHLLITSVAPASEFLDDMLTSATTAKA